MREFGINVTEALKQGLPPDERAEARGDFVSKLVNIRPTSFGGEGVEHINMPAGLYDRLDWPFPQVFNGSRHTFVCTRGNIFEVQPGFRNQLDNIQSLKILNWETNAKESVPQGNRWDFVDLGDAFYFYNGECVVFNLFEDFATNNRAFINKSVPINCGTRFKGRNVFGGLGPGIFDEFQNLLDELSDTKSGLDDDNINPPFDVNADEFSDNYVMWSSIGGGDFPAWLFWPSVFGLSVGASNIGPTWDNIRKKFKRNQMGWMEMPRPGEVIAVEPLPETAVLVYGENYVVALIPTSGGGDVPATFGSRLLSNVGLMSKGAVSTAKGQQIFIGDDGRIRAINTDLQVQTLGYDQFVGELHEPVIEYEPREEEFFISGGYQGRAFSLEIEGPFYEHSRPVSSFETIKSETKGVVHNTGNASGLIHTSFIDFGRTGRKTITQVDVDYRGSYQPYVDVAFRNKAEDPLQTVGWERTGPDGSLPVRVDGKEFKVLVYFPSYVDLEVDDLSVRFQLPDKRFNRGTNADPVGA